MKATGWPFPARPEFTQRELDVIKLVREGYTNQQIAQALVVSTGTVESHLRDIFTKLDVTSRTGLLKAMNETPARDIGPGRQRGVRVLDLSHESPGPRGDETTASRPRRRTHPPRPPVDDADGHDLRPDPLTASTPADLLAALRAFRTWAGEPGFRVMSRRSGYGAAASTMCTTLNGHTLPGLEVVRAIVEGCGGTEDDVKLYATAWRRIKMAGHMPG
jgi:DNA-binding CsgD family transcriptional regulator